MDPIAATPMTLTIPTTIPATTGQARASFQSSRQPAPTTLLIARPNQAQDNAMEITVANGIPQKPIVSANAIVNVRFSTSSVAQGAAEILAYGTAVKVA